MNEHDPVKGSAHHRAARQLDDARHPTDRHAAMFLAVAQRDLAIALASSAEEIAGQPGPSDDPEIEYAAWVARMEEGERWARKSAESSVAAGYRDDNSPNPARLRVDVALADEYADAVARARATIAAMLGPDPIKAAAARSDVLVRWFADDRAAAATLAARFADPEQGA